jgi:membrane protease YdiL (CAAX protease family)
MNLMTSPFDAVFILVIMAPLTEETLCRGLILNGFLKNYSRRKAMIVSALLFALLHLNPDYS